MADVDHATQLFRADWHLKTSHSSKRISLRKRGSSHKIIDYKLASDESENNQRPVVAKLIEESLAERDDHVVNKLVNNSEKPREKLYSSDTSVVQEPPSSTSNIHATKWLPIRLDLPGEIHQAHTEKRLQPVPQIRRSRRARVNWSAAKWYGDLEASFRIRNRAGKAKSGVAVKKEKISKRPDKKQEEQFSMESPEIHNCNGRQTVTRVGLPSKKRANMKDVRTPCPVDGNKASKSVPVKRQRVVRGKSLACDLDFPATDEDVTTEDEEDKSIVNSNVEFGGEVQDLTPEDKEGEIHVSSAEKEELLKRHTIVFDPESQSNVLVECIAQRESSKFIGSDYCTTWNSFSNNLFTTGKLIIGPQKMTERSVIVSEIGIYYVEQGRVKLSLHESERILKDGDFFFIPPGNSWTIDNLQDKEAVLVYNFVKIHKHLT